MIRTFSTISLLCVLAFAACNNKATKPAASESEAYEAFQKNKGDGKHFGEKIDAKGAITYDELVKKMAKSAEIETKVIGEVASVCKIKGCWMNMTSKNTTEPMFVRFKDYGFFMPMDIAGKKVVMKGKAFKETTSVEELRHYAEDEKKSQAEIDAITQPKTELKFMATGVTILN